MQNVTKKTDFRLIYSLGKHPFLGFILEPHIVYLNKNGSLSLSFQRIFSNTMEDYSSAIDEKDREIIAILDELEQSNIIKKHYKKHIRPIDYFTKVWNKEVKAYVRQRMEMDMLKALSLLSDKPLYLMDKDGYPADTQLRIADEPTSVLFHFRRNDHETRYFPTLKYKDERLDFMYKHAQIIVNEQAWLLLENKLYYFDQELEGKKLQPFLNKRYISIPRNTEEKYFKTFVIGLIEKHHVYAKGISIKTHKERATPILGVRTLDSGTQRINLEFQYGSFRFNGIPINRVSVKLEYKAENDQYIFHRMRRSIVWEQNQIETLKKLGLEKENGFLAEYRLNPMMSEQFSSVFAWINHHYDILQEKGFKIEQKEDEKSILIGKTSLEMHFEEQNDWFDVKAFAQFGEFKIPFIELREYILNHIVEFPLPNGQIAIIPDTWFAQYKEVFEFSLKDKLQLDKKYVGLVQEATKHTETAIEQKLEKLQAFEGIQDISTPKGFKGELRPYQKAGFQWFLFLQEYTFGGCLADDMGLGKTIQTLALLQHEKESKNNTHSKTSLLVLPTSLVYNWYKEAEKFTPELKILLHTGYNREKQADKFTDYDIVITTYGIMRSDVDMLEEYYFNYIILDESQNIKNPNSKSFQAIKKLKSRFKLALSGTPIENTVADLWSQMHFLNPGLLGSHHFFQKEFVQTIEKQKDEKKAEKLQAIAKPFILRRTKEQVATELPPKTEQVVYCPLTEEQEGIYESIKSEYRNILLKSTVDDSPRPTHITILQGLTKLRLLANHPKITDKNYTESSGKFEAVCERLEAVIAEKSKVLIFSQFVKHLHLFKDYLTENGINYSYLDGSTSNREEEVERFKKDDDIHVFLISIKAGGVGLNLTEAEYVFILDPWWNPAVEQQAIDRTHRIGQTKNVFVYKFITKDTVEEKIVALQERKKKLAEHLITTEESFMKSLSKEDLQDILM